MSKTDYKTVLKIKIKKEEDNHLRLGGGGPILVAYDTVLSRENVEQIERQVVEWLNNDDPSETQLYFETKRDRFYFTKSTISLKSCINHWEIYNIADSANWSRLISSNVIASVGDNLMRSSGGLNSLPNEIKSEHPVGFSFLKRLKNRLRRRKVDIS